LFVWDVPFNQDDTNEKTQHIYKKFTIQNPFAVPSDKQDFE